MGKIKAIEAEDLTQDYSKRYVIIDEETGEILDDAQGYGYKTPQKAYSAYGYRMRDKSKDKEKENKKQHILEWIRENPHFIEIMDVVNFEISQGTWGPDAKFNVALVRKLLKDNNYTVDFTVNDLIKTWKNKKSL